MNRQNKKFKYSRLEQDIFPIFLVIVALFSAYFAAELLVQPTRDLNEGSHLIYITVITLTSTILDPVVMLFNIEKKISKYLSLAIGVVVFLVILSYTEFYSASLFKFLISFSRRGGFTAISVSILLFQLAHANYHRQLESEEKKVSEQSSDHQIYIESQNELLKAKQRIIELEKEKSEKAKADGGYKNGRL